TTVAASTSAHAVSITFNAGAGNLTLQLYSSSNLSTPIRTGQGSGGTVTVSLTGLGTDPYYVRVAGRTAGVATTYDLHFVVPTTPETTVNDWTVMVYMTASSLAQFAAQDINEMEAAAATLPPSVKIAALWDQSSSGGMPTFGTGNGTQSPWGTTGRAIIQP